MNTAEEKRTQWHISEPSHGTFLMHNNYCVARINDRDPQEMFTKLDSFDALTEANKKLVAALENAAHRVLWLRQFASIQPESIDDELSAWDALVKSTGAK